MSSLTGNLVRFPAFGRMMSSGNPEVTSSSVWASWG